MLLRKCKCYASSSWIKLCEFEFTEPVLARFHVWDIPTGRGNGSALSSESLPHQGARVASARRSGATAKSSAHNLSPELKLTGVNIWRRLRWQTQLLPQYDGNRNVRRWRRVPANPFAYWLKQHWQVDQLRLSAGPPLSQPVSMNMLEARGRWKQESRCLEVPH